jgi:hypothetical protein
MRPFEHTVNSGETAFNSAHVASHGIDLQYVLCGIIEYFAYSLFDP